MCGKYYADREFIPRLSTLFQDVGILPDTELREEWDRVLCEDGGHDVTESRNVFGCEGVSGSSSVSGCEGVSGSGSVAGSEGVAGCEGVSGSSSDHDQILDVSPTDRAVVISQSEGGLIASKMKWGFRDPYHAGLVINARSESAAEKPMFAESVLERRCVIPASGYYEWDRSKSRYRFTRPDGGLVLLAGIFRQEIVTDLHRDPGYDDKVRIKEQQFTEPHFTILTAPANECMKPVHPRMPVTVDPDEIRKWIMDRGRIDELLGRDQMELLREQDSGQIVLDLRL